MRYKMGIGMVPLTMVFASCSQFSGADACVAALERPAKVLTEPEFEEASLSEANVYIDVTSVSESPVRITVKIDDTMALDVEVPGTPSDCSHQPVYKYAYQLTPGQSTVTATTDQGQRQSIPVAIGTAERWLVLSVQEGFPLGFEVWREKPSWG